MSESNQFRRAGRRLLFPEPLAPTQKIPGAGSSAAGDSHRHTKVKITINLDGEVVQHFKILADEQSLPYQTLINQVLRSYVAGSRPERLAEAVGDILASDPGFLSRLQEKLGQEDIVE